MRIMLKSSPYRTRAGLFVPANGICEVEDDEGVALIKSGFAMAYHGAPRKAAQPRVENAMATPLRDDAMRHLERDFIPPPPFPIPEDDTEDKE